MPKVSSDKRSEKKSGWGTGGQLFGNESNENAFQGGGFKDKEKALETIRLLNGRDITYQFQVINSMYNRAKVILKRTTDKDKRQNLSDAIDTFEEWIDDYKENSRHRENFSYLNLDVVEGCKSLALKYGINDFSFLEVYQKAEGDLKKLRTEKVPGKEITWDVERNNRLKELSKRIKDDLLLLYETEEPFRGLPSKEHTEMILNGYSGDPSKIKKSLPQIKEKCS